jgi:hypothetical protein
VHTTGTAGGYDYALAMNSQRLAAGSSKTAGYAGGSLELKQKATSILV